MEWCPFWAEFLISEGWHPVEVCGSLIPSRTKEIAWKAKVRFKKGFIDSDSLSPTKNIGR